MNKTVEFTKEMRETHTILIPQMLEIHFELIEKIMRLSGLKAEVLKTNHKNITEEGLRSVHNDTCYPALLVIGQFIDALKSGKYDVNKTALLLMQTGGGCRASNYISLLRRALEENGFGHVPVISLNFSGLEKNEGFKLNLRLLTKLVFAIVYGDFLTWIYNQCLPYEVNPGESRAVVEKWQSELVSQMKGPGFVRLGKNYRAILEDFSKVKLDRSVQKVKVGIVGEIYLKFSPLGNNNLEQYLVEQGAEVVNSGLLDFCMYCVYNGIFDKKIYGKGGLRYLMCLIAARYMTRKQRQMIAEIKNHGQFTPPADFRQVVNMSEGFIDHGVKMGEGWLLTAEMLELIHSGVNNIVSAQPFGCLPNHIVAKGMIRRIKDKHPSANIVAIDYDPGASRINQENRLRLMLSTAKAADSDIQYEYVALEYEEIAESAVSVNG